MVVLLDEPHKVDEAGVNVIVGLGFTTTCTVLVLVHPAKEPVTVYVVVTVGEAVGEAQLVQLKVDAGDHV